MPGGAFSASSPETVSERETAGRAPCFWAGLGMTLELQVATGICIGRAIDTWFPGRPPDEGDEMSQRPDLAAIGQFCPVSMGAEKSFCSALDRAGRLRELFAAPTRFNDLRRGGLPAQSPEHLLSRRAQGARGGGVIVSGSDRQPKYPITN